MKGLIELKKAVSVIISLMIIVFIAAELCYRVGFDKIGAFISGFTYPTAFDEDNMPLSQKYYERLNPTEKQAYICILNKIEEHPGYIKIPHLTNEEFNNVFFAVKNDNPQILCFADSCNMISFLSSSFLELNYKYSRDECSQMEKELDAAADSIASQATEYEDEFERELFIHDYIIKNCVYEESENDSSAYGALIDGKAVCSGYSRAAMLVLCKAGIVSTVATGTGISETLGNISHMWNIVWIDGKPYHLDVTWDDPKMSSSNNLSHLYFNRKTEDISIDHKDINIDFGCDSDDDMYFFRENLYFDEYSDKVLNAVIKKFTENIDSGVHYIEFSFSNSQAYSQAVSKLLNSQSPDSDINRIMGAVEQKAADKIDLSHVSFSQSDGLRYIRIMVDEK